LGCLHQPCLFWDLFPIVNKKWPGFLLYSLIFFHLQKWWCSSCKKFVVTDHVPFQIKDLERLKCLFRTRDLSLMFFCTQVNPKVNHKNTFSYTIKRTCTERVMKHCIFVQWKRWHIWCIPIIHYYLQNDNKCRDVFMRTFSLTWVSITLTSYLCLLSHPLQIKRQSNIRTFYLRWNWDDKFKSNRQTGNKWLTTSQLGNT